MLELESEWKRDDFLLLTVLLLCRPLTSNHMALSGYLADTGATWHALFWTVSCFAKNYVCMKDMKINLYLSSLIFCFVLLARQCNGANEALWVRPPCFSLQSESICSHQIKTYVLHVWIHKKKTLPLSVFGSSELRSRKHLPWFMLIGRTKLCWAVLFTPLPAEDKTLLEVLLQATTVPPLLESLH